MFNRNILLVAMVSMVLNYFILVIEITNSRPLSHDLISARPKYPNFKGISQWDAWKSKEGMTGVDSMSQYVKLVKTLEEAEG